jgi:hypothetical protein
MTVAVTIAMRMVRAVIMVTAMTAKAEPIERFSCCTHHFLTDIW